MDTQTLIAAVCQDAHEAHVAAGPEFKATLANLQKVAERALASYQAAPFPGRALLPWVKERVDGFLAAVVDTSKACSDTDCLPALHPGRQLSGVDPWAELIDAEERIQALQKNVLESVTRAEVRKSDEVELVKMNRRLSHLYEQQFSATDKKVGAGGISRHKLVKAAALVHEELERRALLAPEEPFPREWARALYDEALKARTDPEVLVYAGCLEQHPGGVRLWLSQHADLLLGHEPATIPLDKLAQRFSADGSCGVHRPFVEPHEATYEKAYGLKKGVAIGDLAYTVGATTNEFTEFFVTGALQGALVVGKESVLLRKSLVPYVLTKLAVDSGYMPPEGESALPVSLEWDVPPELRYWKSACGQDAREVRDQLVASELFTEESVQLVQGLPRRTFIKRYVVDPLDPAPSTFAQVLPETRPEAELFKAFGNVTLTAALEQSARAPGTEGAEAYASFADEKDALRYVDTQKSALAMAEGYLLAAPDSAEVRAAFKQLGRPFTRTGAAGRVFVSSHPLPFEVHYLDDDLLVLPGDPLAKSEVSLVKSTAADEEQYVLGVVLEPDVIDAQADTYSADEVRKSAHRFMAKYQNAGLMHQTLVNDQVKIVESYLAPSDCEIGGQSVKKGTWLMGMVVQDPALWTAIKAGTLTGFSIGGSAIRTPDA